ncbi:hypothetical protein D9M72_499250 [compost metagenome]
MQSYARDVRIESERVSHPGDGILVKRLHRHLPAGFRGLILHGRLQVREIQTLRAQHKHDARGERFWKGEFRQQ